MTMECTESRDPVLLRCQIYSITITNLRGAVTPGTTKLFVRCFVAAGSGNRIRIDTREAHVRTTDPDSAHWAEPASLQCLGPSNVVKALLQEEKVGIVFELRRRKSGPILPGGSELVGRAELAWRDVAGDVEKRIGLCGPGGIGLGPCLVVRMRVGVEEAGEKEKVGGGRRVEWKQEERCGGECGECCEWSVGAEYVFAVAGDDDDAC